MKARYNRISTANQSLERQIQKQHPDEVLYNDVVSGSIPFNEREEGKRLIQEIENGKIKHISVSSIDRLGRNLLDIISTLDFFTQKNITLQVDNLGIQSMVKGKKNPTFDLIISVMANVAAMERETLLERQREGIAIAKANGKYKGRVRGSKEPKEEFLKKHKQVTKLLKDGFSIRKTAKLCDVSPGTVQKVKKMISSDL
jgi:DNA invertase Pin-like site-specific DNA recombinase